MRSGALLCGIVIELLFGATLRAETAPQFRLEPIQRMVFVGDSITVGVGVKNMKKDRYAALTVEALKTDFPQITEINLGRSAQALCQQPDDYAKSILDQNPDTVVIQWGVNDHFWGYSVHQFNLRYDQLVGALRQAKPRMPIVVSTLAPDYRWPETQEQWIAEANVAIHEIAVRHGCYLAQIHEAFNHDRSLQPDGIHPNNAGAEAMAKAIVAALKNAPLNPGNLTIHFDQGSEVRFCRYSFIPRAEKQAMPNWVQVSQITRGGMLVHSAIPLTIRTAPSYSSKDNPHQVVIRDAAGAVVESVPYTVGFSQTVEINLKPKAPATALKIEIIPTKSHDEKKRDSAPSDWLRE